MSKYKRLDACPKTFLITYHNEAIDDAQLYVYEFPANNSTQYGYTLYAQGNMSGIRKDVYLGYEDANNIFEGKLSEAISNQGGNFQLDCNDDQCSGHFSFNGTDNTGAPIKFSLNTCTQDRLITFSYKNTPIFKIQQTYDKTKILTIYVCKLNALSIGDNTRYAFFNTRSPVLISTDKYEPYIQFKERYQTFISNNVLMYTEDKKVREDTDIGTLLSTGRLTHLSGHDYLTQDKYNNLQLANISNITQIHHFEESGTGSGVLTTVVATIDMNIYVYAKIDNNAYQYMPGNTVNFSDTESTNHLGVYKLQIET